MTSIDIDNFNSALNIDSNAGGGESGVENVNGSGGGGGVVGGLPNIISGLSTGHAKRVQRVFSGTSLLAYDITPVFDIRGIRTGFSHSVREISHAEVLRVARGDTIIAASHHLARTATGGGGGGGRSGSGIPTAATSHNSDMPRAAHAPTHSLASMRDLHALHWELAATSPPSLTTRRGCVIIALSPLRAVVTATRALVFFDEGADNDIGRFMGHLNGSHAQTANGGGGDNQSESGSGTPTQLGNMSIGNAFQQNNGGGIGANDSFEYSIIASILRSVSESAAADYARLSREIKHMNSLRLSAEALFDRVSVSELGVTEVIVMLETLVAATSLVCVCSPPPLLSFFFS